MIRDQSSTLRMIKQLTQALERLMLGKTEEELMKKELGFDLDALMGDIFATTYEKLAQKNVDELVLMIEQVEARNQPAYFEMMGDLFYFDSQKNSDPELAKKAKVLYQKYLETSGVFSLPIINRMNSIN